MIPWLLHDEWSDDECNKSKKSERNTVKPSQSDRKQKEKKETRNEKNRKRGWEMEMNTYGQMAQGPQTSEWCPWETVHHLQMIRLTDSVTQRLLNSGGKNLLYIHHQLSLQWLHLCTALVQSQCDLDRKGLMQSPYWHSTVITLTLSYSTFSSPNTRACKACKSFNPTMACTQQSIWWNQIKPINQLQNMYKYLLFYGTRWLFWGFYMLTGKQNIIYDNLTHKVNEQSIYQYPWWQMWIVCPTCYFIPSSFRRVPTTAVSEIYTKWHSKGE